MLFRSYHSGVCPADSEEQSSAEKATGSAVAFAIDSGGMAVARTERTDAPMLGCGLGFGFLLTEKGELNVRVDLQLLGEDAGGESQNGQGCEEAHVWKRDVKECGVQRKEWSCT